MENGKGKREKGNGKRKGDFALDSVVRRRRAKEKKEKGEGKKEYGSRARRDKVVTI